MFSPQDEIIASSSSDGTVRLWNTLTGECIGIIQRLTNSINSVAFSSQGDLLATSSDDQRIYLLETSTLRTLRILEGHTNAVESVSFSSDGKTLASGGREGVIRLWDIKTGECFRILRSNKPYEGMNITGVKGLTEVEKATLKALGAVEDEE